MPRHHVSRRFCATMLAAIAGASVVSTARLSAQTFRGTLQTTAHGIPVAGAIVLLEDTLHAILAKGRSDESGAFVLRPMSRGRFSLRVQRIGMRPYESAPFELTGDTTAMIALNELPFSLPKVTSSAAAACREKNLASSAMRQIWEDVRTALIATSLTYAEQRNRFTIAEVRRVYGIRPPTLRSVALMETAVTASQPWTSFAPDILAERGYVAFADDRLTFVSPDLDVLLSTSFENTHCFEPTLARDGALLGLSFDPGQGLRNHTDITGTFWLDSASHELRRLTFHHTGLPIVADDSAGESVVQFATFGKDEWFIPEWTIRAPVPALAPNAYLPPIEQLRLFGDVMTGRDSRRFLWRLSGVNEQRGAVTSVFGTSDTAATKALWRGEMGGIRVAVTSIAGLRGPATPASDANVELMGSARQLLSDSSGTALFDGLTSGDYRLSVSTLAYTLFAEPPVVVDAHVNAGAVTPVAVVMKSPTELSFERCRDTLQHIIVGSVVHNGEPVPAAQVSVYEPTFLNGVRIGTFKASKTDGRFVVCTKRAGPADSFELRVNDADSLEAVGVVRFGSHDHIQAIDLILARRVTKSH